MKKSLAVILSLILTMTFAVTSFGFSSVAVKSIKLNSSKISLQVGKTFTFKVTFTPNNATNKRVSFSSKDSKIATVDKNGKINGISAGNTVITVTSLANKKVIATCNVTVASAKGKVTMWGWDENGIKKVANEFNKVYPGIKIVHTPVGQGDYLKKVQTSVAAGMELPDILWANVNWRSIAFSLDIWEDLEKAPYNFNRNSVFPYLIPMMTNPKGKVVGIEWCISPTGIAYKTDLAKKYLGTDDPKKIKAMFPNWDAFIQKGKEVNQVSDGKVFMMTGLSDLLALIMGQNNIPILDGNTINATKVYGKYFDIIEKFRDGKVMDKIGAWTPAWNASYADQTHIFYPCATWSLSYCIAPNDTEGKGRWRLIEPPGGGFSWGGTTLGITNTSKNKDLAWMFIKWNLLTPEGAKVNKELINYPTALKSAYDNASFTSMKDEFFGDQDIGQVFFKEIASHMNPVKITKNDEICNQPCGLVGEAMIADEKMSAKDALAKYMEEVKKKLPDYNVK